MPKISVIVPVYNAESGLRRCVESIVFGEEQDLEVILLEDCSKDGSWTLCQKLAEEYPQVKCFQNDRNRGVSYTRNRGLDTATGRYLMFVDSDDWVSGSYAKTLVTALEENPGKMVVCGYTFIDHTSRSKRTYVLPDRTILPRQEFSKLSEACMLQQLWNKVFCLSDLRKAGIRFDETICMGEDYQFIMDAIEALDFRECVIIQQPLYYYIRWGNGSLMDEWKKHERYEDALNRAMRLEKLCGVETSDLEQFKAGYAYRIIWETKLPKKQKLSMIREILGEGKAKRFYRRQRHLFLRVTVWNVLHGEGGRRARIVGKIRSATNRMKIQRVGKALKKQDMTIISQNCIGGVFSHDMGFPFRSPTVNLFIPAADFVKFVNGLEHYLDAELQLFWDEEYPVGRLDDIEIHFVHYEHCTQAREAWERRIKRVNMDRVFVLSTDRDGFNGTVFQHWKTIPYPKLLLTAGPEYTDHPDTLYFPKYKKKGCVPDLIPKREFYKGNVLIDKINAMEWLYATEHKITAQPDTPPELKEDDL